MNRFAMPYWTIYQDETPNSDGAGGGGAAVAEGDLNIDIGAVSDSISGKDLGLGGEEPASKDKGGEADPDAGSASSPPAKGDATPPADAAKVAKEAAEKAGKIAAAKADLATRKVDFTGKTDDEILALAAPQAPQAPKAWKKELHEHFGKLPAEVQAYIQQREAQVEEGFKQYAASKQYADAMQEAYKPYEALLVAQGAKDPVFTLKTLMNAHYVLSTAAPEHRASFMAGLLKNYNVDLAALTAAATKVNDGKAEDPAVTELRQRTEKLERERAESLNRQVEELKSKTKAEVDAFASDPKHPYFNEVAREVTLLLQDPSMTLEAAYESAIWANPVVRAKEQARLKTESDAAAKKAAEDAAKAAKLAKGTVVRGAGEDRASPDLIGSMDSTMRETMRDIKSRQE